VISLDEALFDPFDVSAIAQKMEQALRDEAFRTRLRDHGLQQARRFSWDETVRRALAAWKTLPLRKAGEKILWRQISEQLVDSYRRLVDNIASVQPGNLEDADNELRRIALCIENNERELDRCLRPTTLPKKITWRIEGPFDSSYSLALVNREVARALAALGHRVVLHSTEGPGDFPPNEKFLSQNPDLAEMHRQSSAVVHVDADVMSRNLYPPRVVDMTLRFNFMHAYGWEESGFPLEWVDAFNLSLQGMTVMSKHVRKIMLDHGVTVPIEISSLGVDHWQRVEPDKGFQINARSFRFLHVSSCFPRKGADVMLRAYGRAFRASDDVTLVIKTFPNPHNEIHRWLDEARASDPDYPDVLVLEADYTVEQLKALYGQCHALVAPSRAEGFGLPMAEAILSGLAVITTGWSGQTDFCTPDTAWVIDYTFTRAKTHFGLFASVWAEPDETHLVSLMREVYQLPDLVRKSRISAGLRLLNEKYRWTHAAVRMVDAARACAQRLKIQEPRIGWVTTWNTRCGIATYSEHLINNMPTEVTVLAAQADSKNGDDGPTVRRCWAAGDHDNLSGLTTIIEEHELNTLVVQFNFGFFALQTFVNFLNKQIDLSRIVVVIMHATTDPVHVPHKKLSMLVPALKRCHRILVHTPKDMNRMKEFGLIENVTLFPHGLIDYSPPPKKQWNSGSEFVVASYGFFLPHKGLLELIEAISLLRCRGQCVRLDMVNAEYPVHQSRSLIKQAREIISGHNLESVVSIFADFFSDQESLTKLANADLIVFPYQDTVESASGAVRYGIASGRPVAVTPLMIFSDVEQAVNMLPGQSVIDIAEGVSSLIKDIAADEECIREKEILADRWRAEHRYSKVALRLYNILLALNNLSGSVGLRSIFDKVKVDI
jgi:glycosyltransferase involved in cell wall biosynthesis